MSLLRIELLPERARKLRTLLVPEPKDENRLLVLVRSRQTVQAVRTDRGPLREVPPDLHSGGLERAQALAGAPDLERLVTVDLDRGEPPASLLEGMLQGTVRADPPWIPALERLRSLPAWARRWAVRLLPEGAYGVALPELGVAICVRLGPGPERGFTGATAVDLEAPSATPKKFVALLRRRFGRPQLGVTVSEPVFRAVLASPRPLTALDRATIRGEARIAAASLRIRLTLVLLRILGA
jgi:hypothetical protein